MTNERNILVSSLKLTEFGPVQEDLISKDAKIPRQIAGRIFEKLSNEGLIQRQNEVIEASLDQRVKIAIQSIKLGADFEKVCSFLDWSEFENIATTAFEANRYTVIRGFRFAWFGKRWEIDIVGVLDTIIACVDCKHWHHGWRRAATVKAVEAQVKRTEALAKALPTIHERMRLASWEKTVLLPIILSLYPSPLKFYSGTPIVPILQLQEFLNELLAHVSELTHFLPPSDENSSKPLNNKRKNSKNSEQKYV